MFKASVFLYLTFVASIAGAVTEALSAKEQTECSYAQGRYSFVGKDTVECTPDYILFESSEKSKPAKEVKLGSFNIIRLGTDQSQFKRYDITADIMNQWDFVATVEIMPTPGEYQKHNLRIDGVVQDFINHEPSFSNSQVNDYLAIINESYKMPGYLRLLKALRELDPSWSLLLAPRATGDMPTSLEMTGYYYKVGRVNNIPSEFCANKKGCMLPMPENILSLVSRIPFIASFQAGKLKFNPVALHLRFRQNAPECHAGESPRTVEKEDGTETRNCAIFSDKAKEWMEKFKDVRSSKNRSRYIELALINDALKKLKEEFMLLGDFNLTYTTEGYYATAPFWKRALADTAKNVFVHTKTSISRKNGLSKEYDHFVFNPAHVKGCDPSSSQSFNFLLNLENPTTDQASLAKISQFLQQRKAEPALVFDEFADKVLQKQKLESCTDKSCLFVPLMSVNEQNLVLETYKHRIVETKANIQYKVFEDLISDHIPIYMTCSTR